MASVEVQGARLDYVERGDGEPLVLVHGSASDRRTWEGQLDAFARRFRVIAYSRRFHWPNLPIGDGVDYSMTQQVDDLQALVRALELRQVHLVGHSYGAFLGLLLALRDPSEVKSMVLAEPPVLTLFVSNVPRPVELLKVLATRPRTAAAILRFGATGAVPARRAFVDGDPERALRLFGDAVFGPGGFARMPEARKAQVRDNLSNVRAELLGSGFAPLHADALRALRVPTLLVDGEQSISLFHRLADRLEELMPRTVRARIPGARHAMHEDAPAAFNDAVLAFLSGGA